MDRWKRVRAERLGKGKGKVMPRLSSWFVHSSLVYLAIGFTLGAILLINKAMAINTLLWNLLPVHAEVLLIGWFIQLTIGVAYWILPRLSGKQPRGNTQLVMLAFWLINLGILLATLAALTNFQALLPVGRLMELGGVLAFMSASWKRVRTYGGTKQNKSP